DVGNGEGDEFAAAVRSRETHHQQRHVAAGGHPRRPAARRPGQYVRNVRISSKSGGAHPFGGIRRMRRIPDKARRTTSDLPGASIPAAVWNWLIDETHRVNVAGCTAT